MSRTELARGRKDEAELIREAIQYVEPVRRRFQGETEDDSLYEKILCIDPAWQPPLHLEQWRIVLESLKGEGLADFKSYLRQGYPDSKSTVSRAEYLLEYTTAVLARELGELELVKHRQSEIQFAIPGIGHELVGVALQRYLKPYDAVSLYYRQESDYLMRGGTVKGLWQMTAQKEGDPNSDGVVLAGHPASSKLGILPTISSVGAHVLTGVGVAQALKNRWQKGVEGEAWRHFGHEEAISVIHIGDASMAQGEVMEAVQEMVKNQGCPALLVINHNGGGISTDAEEGSIGGDPLSALRGYEAKGLAIFEVDGSNPKALFSACEAAVNQVRIGYTSAVLHIYNIYKRTHSSSDDPSRYKSPEELARREKLDPLPLLREYMLDLGVAGNEQLKTIEQLVKEKVIRVAGEVLSQTDGSPERIYHHVYSPSFRYGPVEMNSFHPSATGELDLLQSSRQEGVVYPDKLRTDTQQVNMRQAITITLAQEMAKDDRMVMFGEDIADFSTHTWQSLNDYLEQRLAEREGEFSNPDSREKLEKALNTFSHLSEGGGRNIDPESFALLVDLLGGKGGVFKTTQFLQLLYGRSRVWNSRLAEASIVGTAIGWATAGYLPVVEIQFDAYWSPAYQQIVDQLSTLRWRSAGQFSSGMVIRIQGLNRLGGVGGIGHGDVILGKLIGIPGIRTVIPADASETGPLLREAIRLAREEGEPVIFYEPIMELNANLGHLQDENAHLPLGEAQVRSEGKDFLVLTYGNNVPLVEKAQAEWNKPRAKTKLIYDGKDFIPEEKFVSDNSKAIKICEPGEVLEADEINAEKLISSGFAFRISTTLVNLRTLGVQTDWNTIGKYLDKHGKIMIVETERSQGSAGANLCAQISEHFFNLLDAAPVRISSRDVRTPAGKKNEAYALSQIEDIVKAGIKLNLY